MWSPDSARIAFTSYRGDHSFIGVWNAAAAVLLYLDPSTDSDSFPEWSPDGRTVAFIRTPSNGLRPVREARRSGPPWSIRAASAETGVGRELWRAREGRGSVYREVTARNQLLWAGDRLVFPWEADGWTHLYSIAAGGGEATLPNVKAVRYPVLDDATGAPRWPERWPMARIESKRVEIGPLEFGRQIMCVARDDAESAFSTCVD